MLFDTIQGAYPDGERLLSGWCNPKCETGLPSIDEALLVVDLDLPDKCICERRRRHGERLILWEGIVLGTQLELDSSPQKFDKARWKR